LVSKIWWEPLKKLAGAPFFLRRGGLGPLFVHFALLLKKKRNSRGIFQKKSSRKNFLPVYSTTIPTEKYRYRLYLIRVNTDTKKMTGTNMVYNSSEIG